jgi:hypothetical protein
LQKAGLVERDAEKEPQRLHGGVDTRGAKRAAGEMQAEPLKIVEGGGVRRAADERRKVLDAPDVVFLGLLCKMARRHVVDHALTKRADGHTRLLLRMRLTAHSQASSSACIGD